MKVALVGPFATQDVAHLLPTAEAARLPRGYEGAPLMGVLAEGLLARGHEVAAVSTDVSLPLGQPPVRGRGDRFSLSFVPQRRHSFRPQQGRPGRIVDLFRLERRAIAAELRALAPDLVHAHWAYEFGWAALQSGLPHVVTLHDMPFTVARHTRTAYRWLRAGMAWHVMRNARTCTTVSPYMRDVLQRHCRGPLSVIANPLSPLAFQMAHRASRQNCRVGMVCNGFGALKNGKAALAAFSLVRRELPEAELWVWGHDFGPSQAAETWAMAHALSEGVRFLGPAAHEHILAEMCRLQVLVHPSLEESFGQVVAEAMAQGLPVVGGKSSGAIPWLIDDAGALVDVRTPSAIAEAMLRVLKDSRARTDMGIRGMDRTRKICDVSAVVSAYLETYHAALSNI